MPGPGPRSGSGRSAARQVHARADEHRRHIVQFLAVLKPLVQAGLVVSIRPDGSGSSNRVSRSSRSFQDLRGVKVSGRR
jgi:hypothetical protein